MCVSAKSRNNADETEALLMRLSDVRKAQDPCVHPSEVFACLRCEMLQTLHFPCLK